MEWQKVFPPVLLASALLAACAGPSGVTSPETAQTAPAHAREAETVGPAEVPSVVEEIQADMETAVAEYREAIVLIESGSTDTGNALIEEALLLLDDSVNRCRRIPGCDLARAVQSYQEIINLQSAMFETGEADAAVPRMDPEPAPVPSGGRTLNGTDLGELIQLNRYVKDALHDWLTWNRPLLMRTLENYQFLRESMLPPYQAAGLPEALLFGILAVESSGRVHSYSRAGAAGPLQFMRATARRYGLGGEKDFDERLDPAKAAEASVAYLNDQFRLLGGSLEKTLAAYNAGENRLRRLNRRLNGADFWSSDFYYSLPRDTRRYVPQVLAAAWLYLHPEAYRLDWPRQRTEHTQLTLLAESSLSELTICLGNEELPNGWFRALRNLNPELAPGDKLSPGTEIRVPVRVAELYPSACQDEAFLATARDLRDASESRVSDLLPYTVRRGDTLGLIASRYRCMSMKELAAVNNIQPPRYLIRAGKTIKVPNC